MISFPSATAVNRVMPKDAFYKRLSLTSEVKDRFVSDVKHITLQNSLTATTLNLESGGKISEILVLSIDLKKQDYDVRIVENIARQNPHKLLFVLRYEQQEQLAVYHAKLYTSPWRQQSATALAVNGFTLDAIWDSFLEQIALDNSQPETQITELSVEERIKQQEEKQKLEKELAKAERLARAEKQPKKRFELYQRVQELKKRLEGLM